MKPSNNSKPRPTPLFIAMALTSVIIVAGFIFLILWLALRPHPPEFHVQNFIISGLTQSNMSTQNPTIDFNVTVHNGNPRIGISYESLEGSIYYKNQLIGSTHLLDPFYQGPKLTTLVSHKLGGSTLMVNNWIDYANDQAKGSVIFRLEMESVVRYRTKFWDTELHNLRPKCPVAVGRDGILLQSYKDVKCDT